MRRAPHENVATVLVDPRMLRELEMHLMALDQRLWPVTTAPNCEDWPRFAFQIRLGFGGVPCLELPRERTA